MSINVYNRMGITLGMDKIVDFSILSQKVRDQLGTFLGRWHQSTLIRALGSIKGSMIQ